MVPKLQDELDLSYFDTQFTSMQPFESVQEDSQMRISVTGGMFEGFTFDQTAADAAKRNNGDTALDLLEEEEDEEDDSAAAGAASLPPPIDSLAATGDGGEL